MTITASVCCLPRGDADRPNAAVISMGTLEQSRLKSDRKAILKLKKLLAFSVWSTSATADDALTRVGFAALTGGAHIAKISPVELCPSLLL
jgi:hypothetical protein